MPFSSIAPRLLRVRPRRGGGAASYFGGDLSVVESATADILAGVGISGRAGSMAALELVGDYLTGLGTTGTASGDISTAVVTNRTTGPAPLGVHFDATGTTSSLVTYPFHDLTYIWNYGDPTSGTFALTTGNSQNSKVGPAVGSHIYKTPGNYTASLVARLGVPWVANKIARVGKIIWHDGATWRCHTQHLSGSVFSAANWTQTSSSYVESTLQTVAVTVTDPGTAFSSAQTICVAADGVFTGMPAAATQLTSLPSSIPSNRRVVLKAGLSADYGPLQIGQGGFVAGTTNVHVSAHGAGPAPRVTWVHVTSDSRSTSHPSEITVHGLDVAQDIAVHCSAENVVILGNTLTRLPPVAAARIAIGEATGYYAQAARGDNYQSVYWTRYIFVCENTAEGVTDGTAPYILMHGNFDRSAVMGNYLRRADEHTFRTWLSNKLLSSDNFYGGEHREVIRGCWKHQSLGPQDIAATVAAAPNPASRFLCSVDDMIGSVTNIGQQLAGFGPENLDNRGYQRCYDATYWRPRFTLGPNTISCIEPFANRVSMHGSVCTNGAISANAWTDAEAPLVDWRGGPPHPLGPYLHEMADYA